MSRALALVLALCALVAPSVAQAQGRLNARVPARASGPVEASGGSRVGSRDFLQRDPEGYADSVNQYAAMANDPVNNRDPTGRLRTSHLDPAKRRAIQAAVNLVKSRLTSRCRRHFRANEVSIDQVLEEGFGPLVRVVPLSDPVVQEKLRKERSQVGGYFDEGDWNAVSIVDVLLRPAYVKELARALVHELEHWSEFGARRPVTGDDSMWLQLASDDPRQIAFAERAAINCVDGDEPVEPTGPPALPTIRLPPIPTLE